MQVTELRDCLTCYRAVRALVEGGKTRVGGLCVYINNACVVTLLWSADTAQWSL